MTSNAQMDLTSRLKIVMRHATAIQDSLYDNIVLPKLGQDDYQTAYTEYVNELGGFDVRAFRKCIEAIREQKNTDPQSFANWSEKFKYIGEYVNARNNFNEKAREINECDGTPSEKAAMWDTLDRHRTTAHNGVISLFNDMNKFATQNSIAMPYPTLEAFDKGNPNDRAHVADILMRHETLLETVNLILADEKTVESESEKSRQMTYSEQMAKAIEIYNSLVNNVTLTVEDLTTKPAMALS